MYVIKKQPKYLKLPYDGSMVVRPSRYVMREILAIKGLTTMQASKKIYLCEATISRFIKGVRDMDNANIEHILKQLEVTPLEYRRAQIRVENPLISNWVEKYNVKFEKLTPANILMFYTKATKLFFEIFGVDDANN